MLDNYNIRDDYYVERYFEEKELSEFTQETYEKDLIKFCKSVKRPLKDIIDDCKSQQGIETEEILDSTNKDGKTIIQRRVIKFDVDGSDSLILQYFKQFEKYCKSRGNKNTTINSGLDTIRAVLSHFKVELPNFPNLSDDSANWEVLSKEDLQFVLADSSLMHKSLILFMVSTGFRIYDCLDLTIGEYMDATSDFHDFVEVDDFIDNAPDDMRGYWDFEPHKTRNKHTLCKTFNSEESNKFILQNLRRLKNEYMPRKSKRIKKKLKLTKSDSLFGSKRGCYKKSPTIQSISTMFGRKNKELYVWHINKINQNIKEGKISAEDYDKYVDLIPKFHPHACRKYFCTMIERHTSNERRYRLIEGHAPKNKLDKSYINISKEEIKEVYDDAVVDLSVYIDENKDIEKLRNDFNQQLDEERKKRAEERKRYENERQRDKQEKEQYEQKIALLEEKLENQGRQITETVEVLNSITTEKTHNNILNAINTYCMDEIHYDNPDEEELVVTLATDYAIEHRDEFEFNNVYIANLIKRIKIKIAMDGRSIEEQLSSYTFPTETAKYIDQVGIILEYIDGNKNIMELLGNNLDILEMENYIESQLINSKYDVENLNEEDYLQIAEDAVMEYLS